MVGLAEASSRSIVLADTISEAFMGGWAASNAAPAASVPSRRSPAVMGRLSFVEGRENGVDMAMVGLAEASSRSIVLADTISEAFMGG